MRAERTRIEILQDCLSILAEGSLADAREIVRVLNHLREWNMLDCLWRPTELPVTARRNLAEKVEE